MVVNSVGPIDMEAWVTNPNVTAIVSVFVTRSVVLHMDIFSAIRSGVASLAKKQACPFAWYGTSDKYLLFSDDRQCRH